VNTDSYYSTSPGLGDFFHIQFPSDWRDDEKYDFNWAELKTQADRLQKLTMTEYKAHQIKTGVTGNKSASG
jgi:hypothetical protein